MAVSLFTLDPMAQARAGEYSLDSQPVDTIEGLNTLRAAEAMYQLATSPHPQVEVDVSREGNIPMVYGFMTQSSLLPASRYFHDTSPLQYSQNFPVIETDGFRYERVQGFPEEELSFGESVDGASRHEYLHNMGDSSLGNDQRPVLLTFPAGEADAVAITERDMEGLQPFKYLSNNIIDFYIKYLERRLDTADRNRFYFFNSFFCRKLLGNTSASNDIDQCKVDYEQVRKWSGEVNLFEKDYVFIPVLRSSHWSLIIICHLSSLSSSADKKKGSPCILHLDAVEGQHENFKRQVRSFISKAWMEKHQASNNMDQLLDLCQMKYVQAQVPRQKNDYDCGVYLLHYVEVFLLQSTSLNFNFAPSKGVPLFTSPDFAEDVSVKRMAIHKLISRKSHEQAAKSMDTGNFSQELGTCLDGKAVSGERTEDVQNNGISTVDAQVDESKHAVQFLTGVIAVDNNHQQYITETEHTDHQTTWESGLDTKPLNHVEIAHEAYQSTGEVTMDKKQQSEKSPCAASPKPLKVTKKRKWTEGETLILLKCRVEGGRFCKENQIATRWDIISQEIKNSLGSEPSPDQCRLRYDTLLKAYKTINNYCMKCDKSFSEITEAERLDLKLATTLTEGWYEAIDEICHRCPPKAKSQKRVKLSPSDDHGLLSLNPCNPAPLSPPAPGPAPAPVPAPPPISALAPIPTGTHKAKKPSQKQVAIPGFSTLDKDLRFTLLNLIQILFLKYSTAFEFGVLCQWLAIVQDQTLSMIRSFIFQLLELKLVSFKYEYDWSDDGMPKYLNLSNLWVYKKFLEKVLRKNPNFDMYLQVCNDYDSVSFPKMPSVSLSLQRIRVLSLCGCKNLECAELSDFPELRLLDISGCENLKSVTGWEVVKELGWLEIARCDTYEGFPRVQCLPSLRELRLEGIGSSAPHFISVPDLSQCVRLRRLEIYGTDSSALNGMDLSKLGFLEVLSFRRCSAVTTIQGLSGLHSLTKLDLGRCEALRRVPELGCLKALTHLDMSESGVEEIPGVEGLHSLTKLDLSYCYSLKTLPWLGCLKALTHLDMPGSGVEEISGVGELHSLIRLDLSYCSSLKTLPWLGHLKALVFLDISLSGVEEIPGVEDLVSLETLGSRLKGLPDLHHLPRLRRVLVQDTPLTTTDPHYWKIVLEYNSNDKAERMGFVDEISDISDTE